MMKKSIIFTTIIVQQKLLTMDIELTRRNIAKKKFTSMLINYQFSFFSVITINFLLCVCVIFCLVIRKSISNAANYVLIKLFKNKMLKNVYLKK